MTKEQDVENIKKMAHGDSCFINIFEEGGGEVFRLHNSLILFEIPQYGGVPKFIQMFDINQHQYIVDLVYEWT